MQPFHDTGLLSKKSNKTYLLMEFLILYVPFKLWNEMLPVAIVVDHRAAEVTALLSTYYFL